MVGRESSVVVPFDAGAVLAPTRKWSMKNCAKEVREGVAANPGVCNNVIEKCFNH